MPHNTYPHRPASITPSKLPLGLERRLKTDGYRVLKASTGEAAAHLVLNENPDLILLDLLLPDRSGLDICRELRAKGFATPVIMLTQLGEELDEVVGLEVGASDYVAKPYNWHVLRARVRARLRESDGRPANPSRYAWDDIDIDFDAMRATRAGRKVPLTPREFEALRCMVRGRGKVVTRSSLLREVWGATTALQTRAVDNLMVSLRQKLEPEPAQPQYILTVHGDGYKFVG